jgi:hypothetical protein
MQKIDSRQIDRRDLALKVLSWTMLARRPLTRDELFLALTVEPHERSLDPDNLPDGDIVLSDCAAFIKVDTDTGIVRLAHHTARAYLDQTQDRWFPNAEKEIAVVCITYLSFSVFETGMCRSDEDFAHRLQSHCFYDYATRHWGYHARRGSLLNQQVTDFLSSERLLEASVQAMFAGNPTSSDYSQQFPKHITDLHVSAYFGLDQTIIALFESGRHPNCKDSAGQTPLWWSAKYGQDAATQVLCQKDTITLNLLIENNDVDLIKTLLGAGYNVNITDFRKRTPLHNVITFGSVESATDLISAGADLNAKDMNGVTPLRVAISSKKVEMINTLLQHSANTLEILPKQWRVAMGRLASDTLKLTGQPVEGQFLHCFGVERQAEVAQMTAQSRKQIYLV